MGDARANANEVTLRVKELSPGAFSPFGHVIQRPQRSPDARGPGWSWWGETLLLEGDGRPFGVGLLDLQPTSMSFDWAERHMRSIEAILAIDDDCLIYVAPPGNLERPLQAATLRRFEVFRVPPGRGVVLNRGVWHGAPLALERASQAVVLLLEGTGASDTEVVRFAENPIAVEP